MTAISWQRFFLSSHWHARGEHHQQQMSMLSSLLHPLCVTCNHKRQACQNETVRSKNRGPYLLFEQTSFVCWGALALLGMTVHIWYCCVFITWLNLICKRQSLWKSLNTVNEFCSATEPLCSFKRIQVKLGVGLVGGLCLGLCKETDTKKMLLVKMAHSQLIASVVSSQQRIHLTPKSLLLLDSFS